MATLRFSRVLAHAWIVGLALLILGPALGQGFVLSYDLVFTPRQDLLPATLGLGGGLPRAVPQDAVVALIETIVPGMYVEKVVLVTVLVVAGWGMLRLLPATTAGLIAGTFAIVNPFVLERLVLGHWGLLLAYAVAPWAIVVSLRLRQSGDIWDGVRLVLLVAAGALTPTGSLLVVLLAVPLVLLPGSALSFGRRIATSAACVALWLPWVIPSLMHPSDGSADAVGASVFALRPDGPWGPIVTALSGAGIWNSDVVPDSRATGLGLVFTVILLGLALAGGRSLNRTLGTTACVWWCVVALIGLVGAVASSLIPGVWGSAIEAVPGGGIVRDAHKLLAPWVLLLCAAAGMGAARATDVLRDRGTRITAVAALALVTVAVTPDALWGVGGRLEAVEYPGDWAAVRAIVQTDDREGDVVSLPWMSFRSFTWNDNRTVLDPAPRWLTRTTVVSDDLIVETPQGPEVIVGDDPRARAISEALLVPGTADATLARLGIRWALVAKDTPGVVPSLSGWQVVFSGNDLVLYVAPEAVAPITVPGGDLVLVAGVDSLLGMGLLVALGALGIRRVRGLAPDRLIR